MKAAPVWRAMEQSGSFEQVLVHTGQHYDRLMSDLLFEQLELPEPDFNLAVGPGTHGKQTGEVMMRLESLLLERPPNVVIVYGDVNSTMAAALTASKLHIPVAHVEAGLRSFDWTMPEEINRVVTDRVSQILLTPSHDADENLLREGATPRSIHRVGNVMIDSLLRCLPIANAASLVEPILGAAAEFVLVTLHRPATVDEPRLLKELVEALNTIAAQLPVLVPLHPRTRQRIDPAWVGSKDLHLIDPVGYLEFVDLERKARLVITDSGGVQEETAYLGVPCITVRDNTERPITIEVGTNTLVGRDPRRMLETARHLLHAPRRPHRVPELWDGHTGERIAAVLATELASAAA